MIFRHPITKYNIKGWSDILQGQVIFVLGNGPTLTDNNLSLLEPFFTIGINRIFRVFEPTMLFWQDKEMLRSHKQEIDRCPSVKVCRDNIDSNSDYTNFFLDYDPYRFHKTPWHLYGRGCSGGIAVQMAVAMGAKSVVILGCDCNYINGKTDFYGKNKFHRPHSVVYFRRVMQWTSRHCPVPVFNCSANDYWPKVSLEEAIALSGAEPKSKLEFLSMLR